MLNDAIQGDRHTGQQITWYYVGTTTPKPLTGVVVMTGTITNRTTNLTQAITGALTVTDGPNGVFTWAYSAADVATPGTYQVQLTATYGDGLSDSSFEAQWVVRLKR